MMINIVDIKHEWKLKWDYRGYDRQDVRFNSYAQKDWNQTLHTKINQIGAQIGRTTMRGGANEIRGNTLIINNLIKTLEYYYPESNKLSDRYTIVIDDLILDDMLYVYSNLLYEIPMIGPDNSPNNLIAQRFKFVNDMGHDNAEKYIRGLVGAITIENYDKED